MRNEADGTNQRKKDRHTLDIRPGQISVIGAGCDDPIVVSILPAEVSASFITGLFSVPAPPIRGNSGRRGFCLSHDVSENSWEESGATYTLFWGGRPWTLRVDEPEPGLRSKVDVGFASVLSLHGLAATGRFETKIFTPATLVNVERYRSRVQAKFAPSGWGGLTVRAAWSPSCAGEGVDLEVQASATSVGQLRDVEVMVQSQWERAGRREPSTAMGRWITPRDARSAAFSYDGREAAADLRTLTTLPIREGSRTGIFTPPGVARGDYYVEMVQPNDMARQIRMEPSEPELSDLKSLILRYALFGHDFEKGVVFRARMRACWVTSDKYARGAQSLYQEFLNEPPPLGP